MYRKMQMQMKSLKDSSRPKYLRRLRDWKRRSSSVVLDRISCEAQQTETRIVRGPGGEVQMAGGRRTEICEEMERRLEELQQAGQLEPLQDQLGEEASLIEEDEDYLFNLERHRRKAGCTDITSQAAPPRFLRGQ